MQLYVIGLPHESYSNKMVGWVCSNCNTAFCRVAWGAIGVAQAEFLFPLLQECGHMQLWPSLTVIRSQLGPHCVLGSLQPVLGAARLIIGSLRIEFKARWELWPHQTGKLPPIIHTCTLPGSRTNKEITEHSYPTALHIQFTDGTTSPCMAISITRRKIKGWLSHIWNYHVVWVTVQRPIGNREGNSLVLFWYSSAIFSDMLIMAVSCGIHRRRHHRSISPFSTSPEVEKSPATALAEAPQCLQSPGSQGPKKQVCVLVVCVFKSALLCVQYHNLSGSEKLAPSDLRLKKQIWTPKMCCSALRPPPKKKKFALQHVFNRRLQSANASKSD